MLVGPGRQGVLVKYWGEALYLPCPHHLYWLLDRGEQDNPHLQKQGLLKPSVKTPKQRSSQIHFFQYMGSNFLEGGLLKMDLTTNWFVNISYVMFYLQCGFLWQWTWNMFWVFVETIVKCCFVLNWNVIDTWHYISFRYTAYWFSICVYCKMITVSIVIS